ncbi:beta-ketoacyl synthase chain length factor [Kitasatospora sp. LaBMicrA B282]|uniref:beta-ketoacyl synthase chain length factor n=1 Tax=Kitasatospora sp. LaBMicrA B282 TaxID=3420949 RepID=UPI003D0E010B
MNPRPAAPAPPDPVVLARADWPAHPGDSVPPLPGFVHAGLNPLIAEVAARCLAAHPPAHPERTGVLLASTRGDPLTPRLVAAALAAGRPVPPLLFYQSNPNAVAGHLAARWQLAGPVVCTAPPPGEPAEVLADALGCAARLLADGEAEHLLLVVAEQDADTGAPESAVALLLAPADHRAAPAPEPDREPNQERDHRA